MNMLDRAISYLAPQTAARRATARKKMELMESVRLYDGAGFGRRTQNWFTRSTSADQEIAAGAQTLRNRSRDLVRNNPSAARIMSIWTNNLIGDGIMPRAVTGNEEMNEKINELFEKWSKRCVSDNVVDFYGLQSLAVREMVEGGEAFIRRRWRRQPDGVTLGFQVQLLEAEYVDVTQTSYLPGSKNYVVNGIEFDAIGRRRGYWMHAQHPGNPTLNPNFRQGPAFVSAADVCHLYEPQRVQTRGVPWMAPIIMSLKDVDEYNHAEIIRKKIEACVVGIVIPGDNEVPDLGLTETDGESGAAITDSDGNPIERFEPGMIAYAHGGKEIKFNNPAISAGTEMYLRTQYRRIAAGARVPYELLTGDFSQSNFASGRMGLLDFRRMVSALQWQVVIPQMCQPIWEWFIEGAKLTGEIPMDLEVGVEWNPPEFEAITPIDDSKADLMDVRMGKRSLAEVIAKTGRNPRTVLKEIQETNKLLDDMGIILDSDPRRVTINGQMQMETSSSSDQSGAGNEENAA
jgi:lambda family phage portal protein